MNSKKKTGWLSVWIVILTAAWALGDQRPPWKGTIVKEGNVVVVKNPKTPQYGDDTFSLEEDLAIGGQENSGFLLSEITSACQSPDGTIFILDGKEKDIKVFGPDGKFLRTFGKAGEGPGEFRLPRSIHYTNKNEVLVFDSIRRLSFFKPNGDHIRDVSAAVLDLMDAHPDSKGNYFAYLIVRDAANPRYELRKLNGELKTEFVLDSSPLPNTIRDGFNPFFPILRWSTLPGDRAVSGYAVKYELKIYDSKGQIVRKIWMDSDQISISQKDIEERTADVPASILKNMKIPKQFPYFRFLVTDDEDRIYVLTWKHSPDGKRFTYDIFDAEGRYIVRAALPRLIPIIRKGYLFGNEETEEGYPILKRYKMRWLF
ncbi:MAG: 6-bladed beta-propeller [Candidatus Aminicenantes bacterium]|nr:6-bladed beta-propeller [Candidatus Aminicenantes bacterium]